MAASDYSMRAQYNLLATFRDRGVADRVAGTLRVRGVAPGSVSVDAGGDPEVDEARMRDELEGVVGGPGLVATRSMARGAAAGALLGVIVGAVLGLIVGVLVFAGPASGHNVGLWATVVAFAAGLGTAGAVAGGFIRPRVRPDAAEVQGWWTRTPERVVVGVHVNDQASLEVAMDVLSSADPLRLDRIGPQGEVLTTAQLGLDEVPVEPGSGRHEDVTDR